MYQLNFEFQFKSRRRCGLTLSALVLDPIDTAPFFGLELKPFFNFGGTVSELNFGGHLSRPVCTELRLPPSPSTELNLLIPLVIYFCSIWGGGGVFMASDVEVRLLHAVPGDRVGLCPTVT